MESMVVLAGGLEQLVEVSSLSRPQVCFPCWLDGLGHLTLAASLAQSLRAPDGQAWAGLVVVNCMDVRVSSGDVNDEVMLQPVIEPSPFASRSSLCVRRF